MDHQSKPSISSQAAPSIEFTLETLCTRATAVLYGTDRKRSTTHFYFLHTSSTLGLSCTQEQSLIAANNKRPQWAGKRSREALAERAPCCLCKLVPHWSVRTHIQKPTDSHTTLSHPPSKHTHTHTHTQATITTISSTSMITAFLPLTVYQEHKRLERIELRLQCMSMENKNLCFLKVQV